MTRRDLAHVAADAAAGRRVVLSCGQLDGPFLAALQRLRVVVTADGAVSTWGEGATASGITNISEGISNTISQLPKGGVDDGKNDPN